METWKFIKEEPAENEYYESKNDYYDTLRSYSTLDSGKLYDVKIENGEEFVKVEGTGQDPWKTTLAYFPKLYVPLVRLEYSKNKEIMKYLKPLRVRAVTASTKLQFGERIKELDLNLKAECVELETLNNNTLMQSLKHDCYASPWDFVSVQGTCDDKISTRDATEMKLEDKSLVEKGITKEYTDEKEALKKKYTQQTLNFGSVLAKRKEIQKAAVGTMVKFSSSDVSETISKPRSNEFSEFDSDTSAQKTHYCNLCSMDFLDSASLTRHMLHKHNDRQLKGKFLCKVCDKPHARKSDLRPHSESHDPANWYECEVCKKTFKLKNYLQQHIQSHAGKTYTCDICQKVYSRRSTLIRHMMVHNAGSEVRSFTRRSHKSGTQIVLRKSEKIVTSCNNECKKNNQETSEPPLKLYECDVCGERFEKKSSMKVHIDFLHVELYGDGPHETERAMSSSSSSKTHTFDKSSLKRRFRCRTCHKSYAHLGHMRRHETSHLPKAAQSNVCGLCEQCFTTTSSLSRHMLNVHNIHHTARKKSNKRKERPPKNLQCKICDKSFRNLGDLRRHCAIHDARKPYECDTCKKQFAVKGYLYAHILTHDNWKPYPCESCSKLYRRKSSLQRHIDISHSDEKKYKCDTCSKSFKHQSTYRIHMGRFHPS